MNKGMLSAFKTKSTFGTNLAVGDGAIPVAVGNNNTAFGTQALQANTTGANNTAFGYKTYVTGSNASVFGSGASATNSDCAVFGSGASATNSGVAVGSGAFANNSGVAVGSGAFANNTSVAVGSQTHTGQNGAAFGYNASHVVSGANNCAFGYNALYSQNAITVNKTTSGARQTAVGAEAGQSSPTQVNDIVLLGYQALAGANNAIAIGSGARADGAGSVAIGRDSAGTSAFTSVVDEIMLGTVLSTVTAGKDVQTAQPSANGRAKWQLGTVVTAATTHDATRYVEVSIGGTLVKLAVCS